MCNGMCSSGSFVQQVCTLVFDRFSRASESLSPRESSNSWYKVKMLITAHNGESMLTAKCSNPEVIGWDRPSLSLKFQAEGRIRLRCLLVDVEDGHRGNPLLQPILVANSMP